MQLRLVGNAVLTTSWTGLACSYALAYQAVRHDADALRRHTLGWARVLAHGWGVEVAAFGVARIDTSVPCVILANHQSHADVVALFCALPVMPVFLAKQELRSVPLFGRVMQTGGHVFVDRARHDSAVHTIEDAARQLRPGSPLVVFPEGTRGRRPEISRFKKGGFHLARQAQVAIVPVGIRGSHDVWPRSAPAARPGRIEVHVGEPIAAEDVASAELDTLVADVRARIAELAALPLAKPR